MQFYAFDMPVADGDDMRKLPLSMRKATGARAQHLTVKADGNPKPPPTGFGRTRGSGDQRPGVVKISMDDKGRVGPASIRAWAGDGEALRQNS